MRGTGAGVRLRCELPPRRETSSCSSLRFASGIPLLSHAAVKLCSTWWCSEVSRAGGRATRIADTGFSGVSPKFKLPSFTPLPWIEPQRQDAAGSIGNGESGRGGRWAPGDPGTRAFAPPPDRAAAGVSTADSASVPQPRAGAARAAGVRGAGKAAHPAALCTPNPPCFPFYLPRVPPTRHPRQVRSLKQAADRAGTLRNRDGGGVKRGWGTKVPPGKRAQARLTAGLLSPPQLTDSSSPGRGIRPWLRQRVEE